MKNILFRADSSSKIGTGHIMRDLVLAKQFQDENSIFATQDLPGNINYKIEEAGYKVVSIKSNDIQELQECIENYDIDLIVIDHYGIDQEFERQLKIENSKLKVMSLDDTYEKHYCDILLNHNIYADASRYKGLVPDHCELRCGEKYTLLRDEFIEAKQAKDVLKDKRTKTLFIAMGGSDIANLNPKIIKVLEKFENVTVHMVTTTANPNLKELEQLVVDKPWVSLHINSTHIAKLMKQSDLAIVTPSVTMNEVWYMQIPFIAIKVADNQKYMFEFLKKNNQTVLNSWNEQQFTDSLSYYLDYKSHLINFTDLSEEEKARILNWRNHPNIRKWMYHKEIITLEDHLNFINSLKSRSDRIYFLVKYGDEEIGVIDFTSIDNDDKSAEIGLYAKPGIKGVGSILMQNIVNYGFHTLKLETLHSNVYITNKNAIGLYKKFGFIETKRDNELIYMELKNEDR